MADPLVSILLITYQHAEFIRAALDSVLSQDYPHIQIVVGDDGSSDGTYEIVDAYGRAHPDRMVVLPRKQNQGIMGIRENSTRAMLQCSGKYICFLDGDDMYLPGKLTAQVEWMEKDERRVLCAHDVEVFDSTTGRNLYRQSDYSPLRFGSGAEDLVRGRFRKATVSTMVRASAAPDHVWEPRLRLVVDWLFWVECLAGGGLYGYVPGVLARYRVHSGSAIQSAALRQVRLEDQLTSIALIEARYAHLRRACRPARASTFFENATYLAERGDHTAARQLADAALRSRFTLRSFAFALAMHLPQQLYSALIGSYRAIRRTFKKTLR